MEIWKKIGDYNYEASDYGQIRNIKTGRILKQRICKDGYKYVDIQINKDGKTFKTHRLIVEAFYGLRDKRWQVDHINRIRTDNRLKNLRWVTIVDNMGNRFFGEINKEIINEIIELYKNNKTVVEIYKRVNNKQNKNVL